MLKVGDRVTIRENIAGLVGQYYLVSRMLKFQGMTGTIVEVIPSLYEYPIYHIDIAKRFDGLGDSWWCWRRELLDTCQYKLVL